MLSMVERKSESKEEIKDKKEGAGDVIEIPIGKFFGNLRKNPWMVSTVVLAVVVIILLFFKGGFGGGAGGGVTVSEKIAADNLLSFVNSQGQGGASLVSSVREGQLYKVTVNYQNQEVPVYVTLDGKYLVASTVPLDVGVGNTDTTGTDSIGNEKVDVQVGDAPVIGSKTAKVIIVEAR